MAWKNFLPYDPRLDASALGSAIFADLVIDRGKETTAEFRAREPTERAQGIYSISCLACGSTPGSLWQCFQPIPWLEDCFQFVQSL